MGFDENKKTLYQYIEKNTVLKKMWSVPSM